MNNQRRTQQPRVAATLLELILSMAAVSILLGGMASAVYLANQAATPRATPTYAIQGSLVAADVADDLKFATHLLDAQTTNVQIQRTRGVTTEQIAYAWSGVAGDPLTRALNGGQPVNVAEDVHHFQLTYSESPGLVPNLLENADAEEGANFWSGYLCDIESTSTNPTNPPPPSGSPWLRAYNRTANSAGPRQFITRKIRNGTTYRIEAWLRVSSGTQNPRISLHLMRSTGAIQVFSVDLAPINTSWAMVSGVLSPTWTGDLRWAYLKISTATPGLQPDLYCDDVTMTESGAGTPIALDRIGVELQLGPNENTRSAVTSRLVHHPLQWQP